MDWRLSVVAAAVLVAGGSAIGRLVSAPALLRVEMGLVPALLAALPVMRLWQPRLRFTIWALVVALIGAFGALMQYLSAR